MSMPADATLMIDPEPCSTMIAAAAAQPKYTPLRLTAITASSSSSLVSTTRLLRMMPATLAITSTEPNSRFAVVTRPSTCSRLETSVGTAIARPPFASTRRTVSNSPSVDTSPTTTRAPAPANTSAASRPMPPPAPVMTATRSDRSNAAVML